MKHWNYPSERIVFTGPEADESVEVYRFGREGVDKVAHVATVGASLFSDERSARARNELVMVLRPDLGGTTFQAIADFLMACDLYSRRPDVQLVDGYTTDSPLMPKPWKQTAVLFDEPRGDPEELSAFHFGPRHIDLWWVIPIYSTLASGSSLRSTESRLSTTAHRKAN